MSTGLDLIRAERCRQFEAEGYTPEHDARHGNGDLARAAAVYAEKSTSSNVANPYPRLDFWPWRPEDFKPVDRLTCLVKAGALVAAEIDRLLAAEVSS